MFDLVTFGEAMLRLSPPHFRRLEQAESFEVNIGGGELNVAVTATRLGLRTSFVTRLPRNPLGRMVENKTREQGIDTSYIAWSDEDRLGIYFAEFGALPRPSAVLYDRANSAVAKIKPSMVDWDSLFSEARAFHVTGITPALSGSAAETTAEALSKAQGKGLLVSFDLNYRARLWSTEHAKTTLTSLMKYVDILITTEEDTARVFQVEGEDYKEVARRLAELFSFKAVVITLRENITVWRNNWTAIAYQDGRFYEDRKYEVEIVDRIGSGDAFAAGFLYGYLAGEGDVERALKYGNAASVLKHSIPGDINWCTLEEVERLIASGGSLRISR
jgi:2-dehydro-3-deoxygluconokinase